MKRLRLNWLTALSPWDCRMPRPEKTLHGRAKIDWRVEKKKVEVEVEGDSDRGVGSVRLEVEG